MTTPPGPPYPPEGYGPPPLGPQHPMGNPGHRFPPTVQQPPGPQPRSAFVPGPSPEPEPDFAPPKGKGFLGSVLDLNFDYMVTTRMVKLVYALTLGVITLFSLWVAWYGLWFLAGNTMLGIATLIAAPIIWLVPTLAVRMTLEFFINQFKITEYLRIIKDQGERRGQ